MKKLISFLVIGLIISTFLAVVPTATCAAPGESWIGIAVYNPVQYPDESFSIRGIRVNGYSLNENLIGLDIGLFSKLRGNMKGYQLNLHNEVGKKATGLQMGIVNQVNGDVSGVQLGVVNYSKGSQKGVQFGLYNKAEHISGLQLGAFNKTRSLHGVQIGLLNLKEDVGTGMPNSMPMRGFPIVNWTF